MTRKISSKAYVTGNAAIMGSPRVVSSSMKVQVHLKLELTADQEFSPKVILTLKMHVQIAVSLLSFANAKIRSLKQSS